MCDKTSLVLFICIGGSFACSLVMELGNDKGKSSCWTFKYSFYKKHLTHMFQPYVTQFEFFSFFFNNILCTEPRRVYIWAPVSHRCCVLLEWHDIKQKSRLKQGHVGVCWYHSWKEQHEGPALPLIIAQNPLHFSPALTSDMNILNTDVEIHFFMCVLPLSMTVSAEGVMQSTQ